MILQHHAWIKDPLEVQHDQWILIENGIKTDMVSECTSQLTFKKLPLSEFSGVSHIHINYLNENTTPFVRLYFHRRGHLTTE